MGELLGGGGGRGGGAKGILPPLKLLGSLPPPPPPPRSPSSYAYEIITEDTLIQIQGMELSRSHSRSLYESFKTLIDHKMLLLRNKNIIIDDL